MMRRCVLMLFSLFGLCFSNQVLALAYSINAGNDTVFVINEATGQVTFTIPLESSPTALAITPNETTLYIASADADTVIVVNALVAVPATTISGFDNPVAVEVDPTTGAYAAVCNKDSNSVAIIDTASNTIVAQATVGTDPSSVAISPDGKTLYVCNSGSDNVSIVDVSDFNNPIVSSTVLSVGTAPSDVITSPDGELVFTCNEGSNNVSIHGTYNNNALSTLDVGTTPVSLAWKADENAVYVANSANTTLSVIAVPNNPTAIAFMPDSRYAYVVNQGSDTVSVFDTQTNDTIASIPVGKSPLEIAITVDGLFAYVCNSQDNTVSIIDTSTNKVVSTVGVGNIPHDIAIAGQYAYTANNTASPLSVVSLIDLNTKTFVQNLALLSPNAIRIAGGILSPGSDPRPFVCVVTETSLFSYIYNGTTIAKAIATVPQPFNLAINEDLNTAVVVSTQSSAYAVIDMSQTDPQLIDTWAFPGEAPTDALIWRDDKGIRDFSTVFIVNSGTDNLRLQGAPETVWPLIDVGQDPQRIAISKGGFLVDDRLFVTVTNNENLKSVVAVIDPNTSKFLDNVAAEKNPRAITVSPDSATAVIANTGNNTISIFKGLPTIPATSANNISTIGAFVTNTVAVNGAPTSVSVAPDDCIVVAYHDTNTLTYGLSHDPCANTVYGLNLPSGIVFSSNPDHLLNTSVSLHKVKGPWCTETYAKIEWGHVANTAQYEIYRNGLLIATLGSDQLTYEDHDLAPSEEYLYTLRVLTHLGATEDYRFEAIIP